MGARFVLPGPVIDLIEGENAAPPSQDEPKRCIGVVLNAAADGVEYQALLNAETGRSPTSVLQGQQVSKPDPSLKHAQHSSHSAIRSTCRQSLGGEHECHEQYDPIRSDHDEARACDLSRPDDDDRNSHIWHVEQLAD
jgi:hypothetical protein